MKRIFMLIASLLIIPMAGCTFPKPPQEPPKITVTIGDKQIDYVVGKNQWDGAKFDREDTFKTIMKKDPAGEIPYIKIGETATIEFESNPPDKFSILDILIRNDGSQIYPDKLSVKVPIELTQGKGSFRIEKNMASALSSYYEPGKTDIRGFRMAASWGENECEYAFVIRTDAY